jgi:hypothetical protein
MCGIFGVINGGETSLDFADFEKVSNKLFKLSETRGKEASGLTLLPTRSSKNIYVVKSPGSASALIANSKYKDFIAKAFNGNGKEMSGVAFGHTRLVTNGSQLDENNNQPVIGDGSVCVHNGIIVNIDDLWKKHSDLKKRSDVDSEIIVALMRKYYNESKSPINAARKVFSEIYGTASVALVFSDLNMILLATNNGSLYVAKGNPGQPIYFASEKYTLNQLFKSSLSIDFSAYKISHIHPNSGLLVELDNLTEHPFEFLSNDGEFRLDPNPTTRTIKSISIGKNNGLQSVFDIKKTSVPQHFEKEFERVQASVKNLRRCTKCVMTETVPFIKFNKDGVCNFCSNYKKIELRGSEALEKAIAPYRRAGTEADCVLAMSGGRDSCYAMHYVVKELGLKPLAYTYDWGMVTDLARRNISRMCSQLGVEHIIISANIPKKRENIRKNVAAWLKKPHMGMIPLFMAGDKQFVWYANRVKKENNLELDIFSFNLMEKTQFKEEYTGIQFWKPGEDSDKLGEELGFVRGVKLCSFYGKEFLTNPGYWNSSLFDTFHGFVTYYIMPQTFVPLFHYIKWEEESLVNLLIKEYNWELATDTKSSWRIGDGTAAFYNYIYYMVGGFTEHDTLRSNQIREGQLSREKALELIERDNMPRWDSFKWYCDIIGLPFESSVETINKIPKTFKIEGAIY